MSKTLTYEIPDEIYGWIEEAAAKLGRPVEAVALEYLLGAVPKPKPQLSEEELRQAQERLRRHSGAGNSGDPNSGDNERIDADLVAEYENNHEE